MEPKGLFISFLPCNSITVPRLAGGVKASRLDITS